MTKPLPNLPSLHIFKPGTYTAMGGQTLSFTEADLRATAAAYDPDKSEAPLVVGHPQHDHPAYGWVKSMRFADGSLQALPTQVDPAFAEMVRRGAYKKISASFYPPDAPNNPVPGVYYPRHVGFLGAQPPAVKGLRNPAFADDACVTLELAFAEPDQSPQVQPSPKPPTTLEHDRMNQTLIDQLAAANAKQAETDAALLAAQAAAAAATAQLAQFAESAKRDRTAGYVSFADAQIKLGVLLPKDKDAAVAVLSALADAEPVSFAEGGATKTVPPSEWLKAFIASRAPAVSFGEFAAAGVSSAGGQSASSMTEAELDAKVKAYAQQHKLSYADALGAVATFSA